MTTMTRTAAGSAVPELPGRRLGTRPALPRGRAVLGALLIAASAIGLLLAHRAATTPDRRHWLVAAADVDLGDRIEASDLVLVPMDLAPATAKRAFASGDDVVGTVARVPVHAGDLVLRGAVDRDAGRVGPGRRLTVDLPPAQALAGALETGDRVDLLGTDPTAGTTDVLATGALVESATSSDSGLGATDAVRVTLVVADADTARTIVDASLRGDITLIAGAELPSTGGRS